MTSKRKKIFYIFINSLSSLIKHDGVEMAGYLAFLTILSIFPCAIFLTKLITVFRYFINEELMINPIINGLNHINNLPITKIKDEILDIFTGPPRIFVSFAIFGIIWTASSTTQGLKYALNKAYNAESQSYILTRFYSILQFIVVSSIILITIFLLQFLPKVAIFLDTKLLKIPINPENNKFLDFFEIYGNFINFFLLFFYILLINIILPNKKLSIKNIWVGSLLTIVCWVIFTKILIIYFEKFAQFNIIYGSLANITSILIYFYMIFLGLIWGAELNSAILKDG